MTGSRDTPTLRPAGRRVRRDRQQRAATRRAATMRSCPRAATRAGYARDVTCNDP